MTDTINLPFNKQGTSNFEELPRIYNPTPCKRKYTQNWAAYNQAQTKEKFIFLKILDGVIESLNIKTYGYKTGRHPFQLNDMIKCCCIKVFTNFSTRRTMSDIDISYILGYIAKKPHFNSIINYMNNPHIYRFLIEAIKESSIPINPFEKRFIIDATGFSTSNKDKWVKVRSEHRKHREYKKLHITTGAFTNIITSAKVTEGTANDSPHFKELLKDIASDFKIKEVSADAGYLSRENAQTIEDMGAIPYIMPKKNARALSKGYPAWRKMINLFKNNEQKFLLHYHQRSNVESTFSMVKRKFGDNVRSKHNQSQENEILCKVLCHNISVLISAVFELNLDLKYLD